MNKKKISQKNNSNIDLNFDENNYNFNIDILYKVMLKLFRKALSAPTIYKLVTGAKGFGKTTLICLLSLYYTCNFLDWNCLLARYKYNSARDNYEKAMKKVISILAKHGVTIDQAIQDKEIKWVINDNKWEMIWPNGRIIKVIGFDTPAQWEGKTAPIGEFAGFFMDETIPLEKEAINSYTYMYNMNNLVSQILRGKEIIVSKEKHDLLKFKEMQLYKNRIVFYGFNIHDVDHIIYQIHVQSVMPLTPELRERLEKEHLIYKHDFEFAYGLGATVIRGTTKANEANLDDTVYALGEWMKETTPEVYEAVFLGSERERNIEMYSYRKELRENEQVYDLDEFYWADKKGYWFDDIAIGIDYADSVKNDDDTVMMLVGFEIQQEGKFKGYVKEQYILEELVISSSDFKDMDQKLLFMAGKINDWSKIYYGIKENMKIRGGHDSRTIMHVIRNKLVSDFGWQDTIKLRNSFTTILVTGVHGWKVKSRHYTIKYLLAHKRIFFGKHLIQKRKINKQEIVTKRLGHLYHELEMCLNDEKTLIRDERVGINKLDGINAYEAAISHYRFYLIWE